MIAIGQAVEEAQRRGYSPEQLAAIARLVADTVEGGVRAWGAGVVFVRLKMGTPRQGIEAAFPEPTRAYKSAIARRKTQGNQAASNNAEQLAAAVAERQAADRERRLGARLDQMSPAEREKLAEQLGAFIASRFRRDPKSDTMRGLLLKSLDDQLAGGE